MATPSFPEGFLWGASTSAYQVEGALEEDGRGSCVWDTFVAAGRVCDGTTAAVACDHYHRWAEDVALMAAGGLNAYRFSVAWPRVVPDGDGAINQRGLDFYDRLVDGLLAAGIRPMACLHHWDLPQALEDKGGWQGRAVTAPFAAYASAVAARLGDRVNDFMMLNEPNVVAVLGHGGDGHAPGRNLGLDGVLRAMHHQNLAQGAGLRAIAAERPGARLGTVTNLSPVGPETDSPADRAAASRWNAVWNGVLLDGLYRGCVPPELETAMAPFVLPGDLEQVRYPIDLLGINYYSRTTIRHQDGGWLDTAGGNRPCERFTAMGWPVQPDGLTELLLWLKSEYGNPAVFIAENGAAYDDVVAVDGAIHDHERVAFLRDHVTAVAEALAGGCDVRGYLAWSLLDNFEWGFGLSKRFGLVRVDYDTMVRTPKDSFRFLSQLAKTPPPGDHNDA